MRERRRRPEPEEEPQQREEEEVEQQEGDFDYGADLEINPNFLDAEFLNHAEVFLKYANEKARALKMVKLADERVKTLRSQLVKEANETPEVMGKNIKATAPNVEAYYRDHPRYKQVKQRWIDASYYADLMEGVVAAFQARKSALENLVRLHGQSYFSSPQAPKDLPEQVKHFNDLKEKRTEDLIRERMTRR